MAGLSLPLLSAIVVLMLLASARAFGPPIGASSDGDTLPGWAETLPQQPDTVEGRSKFEVLDAEGRIYLWRGFLTPEECDHLISKGTPRLRRSWVVDSDSDKPGHKTTEHVSDIRTSSSMFFKRREDEVVARVERRISQWALIPETHAEGFNMIRYGAGQEYRAHMDSFSTQKQQANGGQRAATVLMYLSDVEEGGETVFPAVPAPQSQRDEHAAKPFSACVNNRLAARPRKGDAVLFHSLALDGSIERRALHSACPVIKGVKYSLAKWIRTRPMRLQDEVDRDIDAAERLAGEGACRDRRAECTEWASRGECAKNAGYMVGSAEEPGACLWACERCDIVAGDGGGGGGGEGEEEGEGGGGGSEPHIEEDAGTEGQAGY